MSMGMITRNAAKNGALFRSLSTHQIQIESLKLIIELERNVYGSKLSGSKTENNTNYNHTKNSIAGWPQWNRLSRIYFLFVVLRSVYAPVSLSFSLLVCLSLKMKANTSTLSLTIHMLSPHVWYGFEHLLFTLVFNLKFNLLKQLKAHTSQPKYTHSPYSH